MKNQGLYETSASSYFNYFLQVQADDLKKKPAKDLNNVGDILALVIDQRFHSLHSSSEDDETDDDADSLFEDNDFD